MQKLDLWYVLWYCTLICSAQICVAQSSELGCSALICSALICSAPICIQGNRVVKPLGATFEYWICRTFGITPSSPAEHLRFHGTVIAQLLENSLSLLLFPLLLDAHLWRAVRCEENSRVLTTFKEMAPTPEPTNRFHVPMWILPSDSKLVLSLSNLSCFAGIHGNMFGL
jgi:hypothetical protein